MKYIVGVAFVLFGAFGASAQHYVGFKGGYGGAQGRIYTAYGTVDGTMNWNKYTGGVMWKYYSDQQIVGGVSAELEYQARGYTIYDRGYVVSDSTSYISRTRTVNSVTLPLIWQPHVYMMNQRVRVFLNAGVTLTYNLDMGDTFTVTNYDYNKTDKVHTITSTTTDYKMQLARDVRWNYGFCGGFGVGVLFGRCEVFAEARYYYGMSDILRNQTKYYFEENKTLRSELDNLFVTVGVFFRIGKGGIKEAPLGRRKGPPVGDNDFRNVKLPF